MKRPIFVEPFLKKDDHDLQFEMLTYQSLFHKTRKGRVTSPHRMSFFLLMICHEGHGTHMVDFVDHELQPGSMLFVAPNQVHRFIYQEDRDAHILLFTEAFLREHVLPDEIYLDMCLWDHPRHSPLVQLDRHELEELLGHLQLISGEYNHPDPFARHDRVSSALKILLLRAEAKARQVFKEERDAPLHRDRFHAMKRLIEAHFRERWQVQDYAHELGVTSRTINSLVRMRTGLAAKAYLDKRLLLEIKRLLAYTDWTVQNISLEMGFDEPTNMIKFFKRHAGTTPQRFRAGLNPD